MSAEIPEIWIVFGRLMYNGFEYDYPSIQDAIAGILTTLKNGEREALASYLNQLLSSDKSDVELAQVWSESKASFFVETTDMRYFLAGIRDQLEGTMTSRGRVK